MRFGVSLAVLALTAGAPLASAAEPPKKKEPTMSKPVPAEVQHAIDVAVGSAKSKEERHAAVVKLAQLGDPAAVVPLASLLDGTESSDWLVPDVRTTLEKLGAVSVLVKKLAEPAVEDKTLALELLGNLGDPRAVEPVQNLLRSDVKAVRERSATTLGRLGDRRAVPSLVKLLSDGDADVRMASAYSLGALGGADAKKALEAALKQEQDGFVKMALEKNAAEARP